MEAIVAEIVAIDTPSLGDRRYLATTVRSHHLAGPGPSPSKSSPHRGLRRRRTCRPAPTAADQPNAKAQAMCRSTPCPRQPTQPTARFSATRVGAINDAVLNSDLA